MQTSSEEELEIIGQPVWAPGPDAPAQESKEDKVQNEAARVHSTHPVWTRGEVLWCGAPGAYKNLGTGCLKLLGSECKGARSRTSRGAQSLRKLEKQEHPKTGKLLLGPLRKVKRHKVTERGS